MLFYFCIVSDYIVFDKGRIVGVRLVGRRGVGGWVGRGGGGGGGMGIVQEGALV